MGRRVLSSLTPFLAPGSTVTLAVRERFVQPSELSSLDNLPHPVEIHHLSDDMTALTRLAQSRDFDEVIVLGYRHGVSTADADAQTMLTLVHLADHLRDARADRGSTRLIGEVLDSRRAELARLSGADDLVVSDRLTGCMLAQLAENPGLAPVFEDLFDAEGATVTLRPITRYATVGETVSFGDLVNAAVQRGDSAIGYRRAGDGEGGAEIRMNPAKSEKMRIMAGDTLVVIGPLT